MFAYDKRFQHKAYGQYCVGAGWYSLVGTVYDVITACAKEFPEVQVQVIQVKEKFGTLRFYFSVKEGSIEERGVVRDRVDGAVRIAREASSRTCETCGKPATRSGGFRVETACPEHAE